MADLEQDGERLPLETRSLVPGSLAVRLGLIAIFIVAAAAIILWTQRVDIADSFAADYLADQGIEAGYDVVDVGIRKQHLRNLVIGDRNAPDLTIDELMVTTRPGFGTLIVEEVRVRGVRLFGGYDGEKLSFGALDPLIFTDSDAAFELPDFSMDIDDARAQMATPYGMIGMALNGDGHLKDGFEGELAVTSERIEAGGCTISKPSIFGTVKVTSLEPTFSGPMRAAKLVCPDQAGSVAKLDITANIQANRTLDAVNIAIGGTARSPRYAGLEQGNIAAQALLIAMQAELDGEAFTLSGDATLRAMRSPWLDSKALQLVIDSAPVAWADLGEPEALPDILEASGSIKIAGLNLDPRWQKSAGAALASTPLEPLWRHINPLLNKRLDGANMTLKGQVSQGVLAISPVALKRNDGAVIARFSGANIAISGPQRAQPVDLAVQITDRALPRLSADIRWADGLEQMDLSLPGFAANGAKLAIDDLRIRPLAAEGFAVSGAIALTGPLPNGKISNLYLPLAGRLLAGNRYYASNGCQSVRFDRLDMADLSTGKANIALCPVAGRPLLSFDDGGIAVNADSNDFALNGDLAGTPWALAWEQVALRYPAKTVLSGLTAQIGEASSATRLVADKLTLDQDGADQNGATGALGGQFGDTAATIGDIPFLISKAEGTWSFDDNGLQLASDNLEVSDREPAYRFNPLMGRRVNLALVDGVITMAGYLHEKRSNRRVSALDITHNLSDSTGNAQLRVNDLRFGPQFQPEQITPLTLGIIANVNGRIDGEGEIRWNGSEVDSDGRFYTDGIDLAAAFGPVKGLAGEIVFSDLLALATPPGQVVTLAEVNPGVAAYDGEVRYQLLPNQAMRLEGGAWPFAGGRLVMEPTVFNLAQEEERYLTFEVVGIDASQFLSRFDFENISATGIFDGRLPMIFDQRGGRIEGGRLVVRQSGGTVAYVGQLTYEDLGSMANFAFTSLRDIRYRSLEIDLNGAIDGDMITQIQFNGLSQGDASSRNFITKQIAKLPIQFNVTIRAPFFQLITSAKSFYDTQYLPDIRSITRNSEAADETEGQDSEASDDNINGEKILP